MDYRVSLTLDGLEAEGGHVRFNVFVRELQLLGSALGKLDLALTGSTEPSTVYRVVALSHSSPAAVTIEGMPAGQRDYREQILDSFFEVIEHVGAKGTLPPQMRGMNGLDLSFLEDVSKLAQPVGKAVEGVRIARNGLAIDVTPGLAARIESVIAPEETIPGFMRGMLESINLHGQTKSFRIYPDVGPAKVTCVFTPELVPKAIDGVNRFVEVRGALRYRAHAPYPHAITVTDMEVFPPESALPTFWDVEGIAPDLKLPKAKWDGVEG